MYSQNDEERFVMEFFAGKTGTLLDVGAFDGITLSNSRKLLELGWSGVLVEPKWSNFTLLVDNSAVFGARVKLVCAAVSSGQRLARFWVDDAPERDWSTTINPDLLALHYIQKPNPVETWVTCITMDDLNRHFGPFDFISLDCEGEDFSILSSTHLWRTAQLICIEPVNTLEREKMKATFSDLGFETAYETLENLIVRNAAAPQSEHRPT